MSKISDKEFCLGMREIKEHTTHFNGCGCLKEISVTEYEELHKDRERLEWMIENRASVTRLEGEGIATNWFIIAPSHLDHLRGTFKTPREAIDAAMRSE